MERSKKSSRAPFNPQSAFCLKKRCAIADGIKRALQKNSIFPQKRSLRNLNPPASTTDVCMFHVHPSDFTPVCSATVPPVQAEASTSFRPTVRIRSQSSSGRKKRETDVGRYL